MPKPFLYLIPLLLLALVFKALSAWLRSRKGKGQVGEWVVGSILKGVGPGYEVLHDLTFVVDGDSTQIDHVVVSTHGVFLIETKNFQGRIFGQATDSHWTQVLGRTKRSFQNPLRQNHKHVRFLSEHLDIKESALRPLVVFLEGAQFPKGKPEGVHWPRELVPAIRSVRDSVLNNAQVATLRNRLQSLGATTSSKTQLHLDQLAKRHGTAISP